MSSKVVKLGLYGCGNRTLALLESLRQENAFTVVAAYDLIRESAASLTQEFGGVACTSSEQLISTPEVDAFLISLDPFAHPAAFYETLKVGKPIFIEKPIAMTAAEAKRMADAAEALQIPVQVGFMRRYRPPHEAARTFIAENDPGALLSISCRWFHAGETEMINFLNNHPDNFRLKVSQIPFHCCHALDIMMLYGGAVKSVSAVGRKVIDRPYPSPDEVIANLEFENGCLGSFHYSSMAYQGGTNYVLHAENYSLAFEGNKLTICRRPALRSLRENRGKDCRSWYMGNVAPEIREYSTNHVDHRIMQDFLNGVATGAPMTAPIRQGHRIAELAEAIERSWQERTSIDLPLSHSHPQANGD